MISSGESRYNQWVSEHYRFLLRSAWALTGSREVAQDVVQDCFTSAWRFRAQLRDPAMARAWLFQIMRRHVFRHMDPLQGLSQPLDEIDMQGNGAGAPGLPLDEQLDVIKALARIAPIHREVLVLFYFDDMPTAQMAQALDIAPGTVLSRLARARQALKLALQGVESATASKPVASVVPLRKRAP